VRVSGGMNVNGKGGRLLGEKGVERIRYREREEEAIGEKA